MKIKPSQVEKLVSIMIEHPKDFTLFITGPPGIGKSAGVKEATKAAGLPLTDTRLTLMDQTDLRGIPFVRGETTHWARPWFIPNERGVWFFDEMNSAHPSVQAATYKIIFDRMVEEHPIHPDCAIIAAGNREEDAAAVHTLLAPLANRFIHVEVEPDYEDWKASWALKNIEMAIISFLNWRPSLSFKFDPKKNEKSFPTYRSWHFASNVLKAVKDSTHQRILVAGAIGDGVAGELYEFLRKREKIPSVEGILKGDITTVPKEEDLIYALIGALNEALKTFGKAGFKHFIDYIEKLPKEFTILAIKDAFALYEDELRKAPNWSTFLNKHQKYIYLGSL